ncbi:unnamed protein product [Schistosoma turkestanicum]|nr:unnamed protein product [Schistosoma turkestanicum]
MNPNNVIGYGWGVGQNVAPGSRWEQPQIGFCFDSPNPQVPAVPPPSIQNPGALGFAYDQTIANPPSVYPIFDSSQPNLFPDRTNNNAPPRPNVSPSATPTQPRPGSYYSDESVAPSAPPEPIPTCHSESSKVITITRQDSSKSEATSKMQNNTSHHHQDRRDSYQNSLKDMAALMTDVELTDDVINGMRKRFDLHN